MKYSCLIFCEGGKDKKFLISLIDLPKFQYYTSNWFFSYDNASGCAPEIILNQCQKSIIGKDFDLVLCFVDLDALKSDHKKNWELEKKKLEEKYLNITIIWQIDKAEDEYRRVLGDQCQSKHKINKFAKQRVEEFINSDFWKRILKPITDKENELKIKEF